VIYEKAHHNQIHERALYRADSNPATVNRPVQPPRAGKRPIARTAGVQTSAKASARLVPIIERRFFVTKNFPRPNYVSPEAILVCRGLAHRQNEVPTG